LKPGSRSRTTSTRKMYEIIPSSDILLKGWLTKAKWVLFIFCKVI